jgi:hypothetical protein
VSGRGRLRLIIAGFALAAPACTVGGGAGTAKGELAVVGCDSDNTWVDGKPYNLAPTFFAGEPIEDICPPPGECNGPHMNRLVIRMQHVANRPIEVNDTLFFDVLDALKVAQCVRGQVKNGEEQWDHRLVTDPNGEMIPGLPWCNQNPPAAGADGGAPADAGAGTAADAGATTLARINLSTQDFLRAYLAPLNTCTQARVTGISLPGSWIEFQDFGAAAQPQLSPDMRGDLGNDFKVEFGQRLRAHFHLELGDQFVVESIRKHQAIPERRITGLLDGFFDFDLERGRAAQPFP